MTLRDDIKSDLDTFFDLDEFAVLGLWKRDGKDPVEVAGNFDRKTEFTAVGNTDIESFVPAFTCKASVVAGIKKGDTLVIDGDEFRVRKEDPNGYGVSIIYLEKK